MADRIGIGIVGLGRWAGAHAEAATRSDVLEIVNCFARSSEAREAFRDRFGVVSAAASIDGLLADPRVEAVIVSTPNDVHVDQALAGVEAGKPVLVDKPVAVDAVEGLELLRASEAAGVPVGVAHHARRLAGIRAAKRWLESTDSGRVRLAHADFSNNRSAHLRPDAWHRFARGSEGGVLIQVGIHQVDNLLYLLGPAVSVNARFAHATLGSLPDLAAVTMIHAGGAVSVVTSSWTTPGYFSVELLATGGNLTFRLDHGHWSSGDVDDHGDAILAPVDGPRGPYPTVKGDPLREQLEELARATRGGSMEVDVAAGLRAMLGVEAAVRSAAVDGAPVSTATLLEQAGATTEEVTQLLSPSP